MDVAIQILSYAVGLPLQVLTITALWRGPWRQFPFVFFWVTASFLATAVEIPFSFEYMKASRQMKIFTRLYWINEGILSILILAVVVGFIYSATGRLGSRRIVRSALLAGAVLFAGISFLVYFYRVDDPKHFMGLWMTPWTRNLKVCSTFLDLALWVVLIGSRQKDRLLLLLTGAMGIMFTGEAIGRSISTIAIENKAGTLAIVGSTIIVLANNVFLYLWWQAFRRLPSTEINLAKKERAAREGSSL